MKDILKKKHLARWFWFLDYVIIPIAIIFIAYQPNFTYGLVDHFESGKELACINEIFLGKIIYREVLTIFGPLSVYLEAFSMFLFGKSLVVLRWYFYIGTLSVLIIGYFIGRNLCQRRFFSFLIAFMLILETYHPFWASRWGGFRFAFGLLAILCVIIFFKKERKRWAFFSGVFVAIAGLTSFDVGILSLAAAGLSFFFYKIFNIINNKNSPTKGLIFFVIGLLAVLIPFSFYFALNNALLPYIKTLLILSKNHVKVWGQVMPHLNLWDFIRPSRILTYEFKFFFPFFLYLYTLIYLINRAIKKKFYWKEYAILCLLVYGSLMYKIGLRAMTGPQFQMALQPVIILGFVFLDDLLEQIIRLKKNIAGNANFTKIIAFGLIFIVMLSYAIFSEKRFYGSLKKWFLYQEHKNYYMATYTRLVPVSMVKLTALMASRAKGIMTPFEQAQEIDGVTRYILSVTNANEAVFTFPEQGIFNFLANRPCLDRFNVAGLAWTTPEWQQELLTDLQRMKPRYIVYGRNLSNLAKSIQRNQELLPEVIEYIKPRYKKEISFGSIDILRRKE